MAEPQLLRRRRNDVRRLLRPSSWLQTAAFSTKVEVEWGVGEGGLMETLRNAARRA